MAEISGTSRSDPTKEIVMAIEENQRELTRDAMMYWFEQSQTWLAQAAEQRRTVDSEGRSGRESSSLHQIQQSAVPPSWDEQEGAWAFSYPHEGAVFNEFGAKPHEVRKRRAEVLAFEWPDAPNLVKEQFDHTEGDLVFFQSINHPGLPAVGFIRRGRDMLRTRLEARGIGTELMGDST